MNVTKKKISFITGHVYNYFFQETAKEFGGVSRVYRLARKLSEDDRYSVKCFVGDYGQEKRIYIKNILLVKAVINKKYCFLKIIKTLLKDRPNLFVEFYASPMLSLLALIKKINRQSYVFFTGNDTDVNGGYLWRSNSFFYYLYKWGLGQADAIICQSHYQAGQLLENYGLNSHVVFSPYLDFKPALKHHRENILWVGRAAYQKNPLVFIEMAKKIPNEKFVMICNESEHDDGKFEGIRRQAEKVNNLLFKEKVQHDRIWEYYAKAKLLVNTSEYEGVPNTFIEAAHEQTPVLSLTVDPDRMFEKHGCGWCCGGNREKLISLCQELASKEEICQEAGIKARRYAEKFHDMTSAYKQITAIFDDVMNLKGQNFKDA